MWGFFLLHEFVRFGSHYSWLYDGGGSGGPAGLIVLLKAEDCWKLVIAGSDLLQNPANCFERGKKREKNSIFAVVHSELREESFPKETQFPGNTLAMEYFEFIPAPGTFPLRWLSG